jgi:hypothetical protein
MFEHTRNASARSGLHAAMEIPLTNVALSGACLIQAPVKLSSRERPNYTSAVNKVRLRNDSYEAETKGLSSGTAVNKATIPALSQRVQRYARIVSFKRHFECSPAPR